MIGMRLTRNGKKVLARGLTGEEIKFTCAKIGSGDFDYDTEAVYDLTELKHYEMTLPLTACEVRGDGTVYVECYLSNAEVVKGFAAKEHGVFAIDTETGEEILYAYRNVAEEYDFVPSFSGTAHKNIYIEYICEIQDAENITATLDLSVAYVGRENFIEHINAEHPHLNTPNHYLDVEEADSIWATDNDNDLHKLKIADLKAMLAVETPSRDERLSICDTKAELGLDANILMHEDFTGVKTYDDSKVKVVSCAMHGKNIGLAEAVKIGARYTISDGISREPVQVEALTKDAAGIHAEITKPLDFTYDAQSTYLYRSFSVGSEELSFEWTPDSFSGYEANAEREIALSELAQDYRISGGKILNGVMTL